jgi:hypothetical protein
MTKTLLIPAISKLNKRKCIAIVIASIAAAVQ